MAERTYRTIQSAILFGLGVFLISKIASGRLIWYIHPRFIPLTILAVVVLLFVGWTVLKEGFKAKRAPATEVSQNPDDLDDEHENHPSAWRLAAVTLPLVVGVLIPAHPLTASAIQSKGINSTVPIATASSSPLTFGQSADTRNILEWEDLFNSGTDPTSFLGQEANVIGFVYHDPHLKTGQFMVGRFALVCCPADAFAVVMVVNWPGSASLPTNQWVKVKGPVQSTVLNGQTLSSIQATSVELVDPPADTYLYP